jgi:hypothetical protein
MREWHVEHMQKTIIKYISGISDTMSLLQARQYMKYYNISNVQKTLYYDTNHGVTKEDIFLFIEKVRSDPSYHILQSNKLAMEKLRNIEKYVYSENRIQKH